jgi:hypothetical protein
MKKLKTMSKSENIQFYANELKRLDEDIDIAALMKVMPVTKLVSHGVIGNHVLHIIEPLRTILSDFLQNYFNAEKEKTYKELQNKLNKDEETNLKN